MVKLDDVAKLAGVSKGTASRVLNNRGYISQQTRERIEAAVKELNYYPNENARNLLKRRSGMIGVVEMCIRDSSHIVPKRPSLRASTP